MRRFRITLATGLLLFILSSAVSVTGGYIFTIMRDIGFVTDNNRYILWLTDILLLFTLAGMLLNFLLKQIFGKKTGQIFAVIKKIADGEFDTELHDSKKITDLGPNTISTLNDIAAQFKANAEFNKDFAGNFSHEMKTPLGTISGFARVLKDYTLTEEEKLEYLNIIIDESERLTSLSNSILLLSRLEKQTEPVQKETFILTEQIRQIVAAIYHKWSEKNIEIIIEGEDVSVCANRELTAQLWINLLDNAIKFSPVNESVHVNVIKNADCITVSIKNYGHTLTSEEIPHIFDKFYQAPGNKKPLGNGIGLNLVRKITELHEGSASAALCEDDSIMITVNLPAV